LKNFLIWIIYFLGDHQGITFLLVLMAMVNLGIWRGSIFNDGSNKKKGEKKACK
jgi:hypothetical protein